MAKARAAAKARPAAKGPPAARALPPPGTITPGPEGSMTRFCQIATPRHPLRLEQGGELADARIAFETHGALSPGRDNAVLVFHALTGSQHVAGHDPIGPGTPLWTDANHAGWWDDFVGPGKAIDTDTHFVVCCNYLGGCYGSTGPMDIDPATGKPWGSRFPWPTVGDIVDAHMRVLEALGVEQVRAVVGGSMGGMCAMDAARRYAHKVDGCVVLASGLRASVLAKSLNFEQIFAIQEDGDFQGGDYYDGPTPWRGLCLARIISHKTYVSLDVMERRARAEIVQPGDVLATYPLRHRIESYLMHQGRKFVERFDANAYLRIIGAWQAFDLPREAPGASATVALSPCRGQHWLVISISSDVCFYPDEQAEICAALTANEIEHQYITVHSDKGHDAFLLEAELFGPQIAHRLSRMGRADG